MASTAQDHVRLPQHCLACGRERPVGAHSDHSHEVFTGRGGQVIHEWGGYRELNT
ncbi:hypothetical protein GCM10009584_20510 [Ornithinimicrobium humiphilum]